MREQPETREDKIAAWAQGWSVADLGRLVDDPPPFAIYGTCHVPPLRFVGADSRQQYLDHLAREHGTDSEAPCETCGHEPDAHDVPDWWGDNVGDEPPNPLMCTVKDCECRELWPSVDARSDMEEARRARA